MPAWQNLARQNGTVLPTSLLVGIFYGSRALGIGERAVNVMVREDPEEGGGGGGGLGWLRGKFRGWVEEGDRWAQRVGTRYGIFGFPKSPSSPPNPGQHQNESARESSRDNGASQHVSERIAGDVANAVVAYAITKALLPLRIGLSLYLSPGFSRRVVQPIGRTVIRLFKG